MGQKGCASVLVNALGESLYAIISQDGEIIHVTIGCNDVEGSLKVIFERLGEAGYSGDERRAIMRLLECRVAEAVSTAASGLGYPIHRASLAEIDFVEATRNHGSAVSRPCGLN